MIKVINRSRVTVWMLLSAIGLLALAFFAVIVSMFMGHLFIGLTIAAAVLGSSVFIFRMLRNDPHRPFLWLSAFFLPKRFDPGKY